MLTHPTESITWIDADDRLPLARERTVLLFVPGHKEPVWPGYYDDENGEWRFCNGAGLDYPVVAWAEMPSGPKSNDTTPTLDQWMERYEAAVESGQANITRAEAERRFHSNQNQYD